LFDEGGGGKAFLKEGGKGARREGGVKTGFLLNIQEGGRIFQRKKRCRNEKHETGLRVAPRYFEKGKERKCR